MASKPPAGASLSIRFDGNAVKEMNTCGNCGRTREDHTGTKCTFAPGALKESTLSRFTYEAMGAPAEVTVKFGRWTLRFKADARRSTAYPGTTTALDFTATVAEITED